jgi:hypothetical protein
MILLYNRKKERHMMIVGMDPLLDWNIINTG